jgi:hypothetical protein
MNRLGVSLCRTGYSNTHAMRRHVVLVTLVGYALAVGACATARQPAGPTPPVPRPAVPAQALESVQWTASLVPEGGSTVTGSATLIAADSQQTGATVTLTGAAPGAIHPWHVHAGRCGDNGPIVGPAAAYPPLTAGSDGTVTLTATLPFPTPMSGSFYVNVHRSPAEMSALVACGNLAIGTR